MLSTRPLADPNVVSSILSNRRMMVEYIVLIECTPSLLCAVIFDKNSKLSHAWSGAAENVGLNKSWFEMSSMIRSISEALARTLLDNTSKSSRSRTQAAKNSGILSEFQLNILQPLCIDDEFIVLMRRLSSSRSKGVSELRIKRRRSRSFVSEHWKVAYFSDCKATPRTSCGMSTPRRSKFRASLINRISAGLKLTTKSPFGPHFKMGSVKCSIEDSTSSFHAVNRCFS